MERGASVSHPAPTPGRAPHARSAFDQACAVADAVLYEGYLLYPYRRSSPKNRVRWQFGILAPRAWAEARGPVAPGVSGSVETWQQQTECVLRAEPGAVVRVRVRYLQVRHRGVERQTGEGRYEPVESLSAGGEVHLAFDEAVPREHDLVVPLAGLVSGEREFPVGAPGGLVTDDLPGGVGRLVRRCHPVEARTTLHAQRIDDSGSLYRLRVRTENTGRSTAPGAGRDEALRHALVAAHTFLGGDGVRFFSAIDPPDEVAAHVRDSVNLHTFPVLAGAEGSDGLALSAPIILPDHPQVAPESPGDLHDAAEIDEILTLRTLLLTDDEKREARATDPRAAHILDRVETMPPEVFARLHGAIRSLAPAGAPAGAPVSAPGPVPDGPQPGDGTAHEEAVPRRASVAWWQEGGGDEGLSPATDSVLVDGVALAGGSRVLLCPRGRGADAQDMFLAGRSARVAAVHHDVDGSVHLAVTLEDDPAAELHSWYGRYLYFRPDEVRPSAVEPNERPARVPDEEGCDGRHRVAEA
ncbi:hypothetical protein ACFSL4_06110 [Streptomyces caeni]|uniref:Uncharacterized protein n=1 Tax=Streptomyces caeni TaxID=2307231 RepID=A0ABW4INQ3_9ACTN